MKRLKIVLFVMIFANYVFATEFEEFVLAEDYMESWSVYTADVNGDGNEDIITSSRSSGDIHWWQNDGHGNFTQRLVSDDAYGAMGISAGDLDNDGDLDIACACDYSNKISVWEQTMTGLFVEHQIGSWVGPTYTYMEYVDDDEYLDVLASACEQQSNRIGWFRNNGGFDFTEHIVKNGWDHANSVYAKDIDDDGDMDIFGTASWAGEMIWFENDGEENFDNEHIMYATEGRPSNVICVDIDQDNDNDIITSVCQDNILLILENDGEENFDTLTAGNGLNAPRSVIMEDINLDGHLDLLSAAINSNSIQWNENDGNNNFTWYNVCDHATGATDVATGDFDNDGDPDIVGSARDGNMIYWWENKTHCVDFSVEYTSGHMPLSVQFTDTSVLPYEEMQWEWDFDNDGTVDSDQQNPVHIYNEPGVYSVSLRITSGDYFDTIIKEDYIQVFAGESALLFNGTNSKVERPANAQTAINGDFTFEAWIHPSGWGNHPFGLGRIFDKSYIALMMHYSGYGSMPDNCLGFLITQSDGTICSYSTEENTMETDGWQYVAITFDGESGDAAFYINGEQKQTVVQQALVGDVMDNVNEPLVIGNTGSMTIGFPGLIDEVRFWDVVRTTAEIESSWDNYLTGDEPGLLGYWKMNEGNGNMLMDASSQSNNCNVYNAVWETGTPFAPTYTSNEYAIAKNTGASELSNYPNPFNPTTTIRFELAQEEEVSLNIYNIKGQLVSRLISKESMITGSHTVIWNGMDNSGKEVGSGVYFYKLISGRNISTGKMLLLK